VSDEEWEDLLQYSSQVRAWFRSSPFGSNPGIADQVLSNLVNYKSFGFTKFIPRIPEEKFEAVVKVSPNASNTLGIWESVRIHNRTGARCYSDGSHKLKEHIYSVTPDASLLVGKPNLGHISNYYTGEVITDEEVAAVQAAAEKYDVDVMNTR